MEASTGGPEETVNRAIRDLFFHPLPAIQVQELARRCHTTVRTLERTWKASSSAEVSLKAPIDWALLLRAKELQQRGLSLDEMAKYFGVCRRTVKRILRRRLTLSWFQFSEMEEFEVSAWARRSILEA